MPSSSDPFATIQHAKFLSLGLSEGMLKKLKELYREYKDYVRVDLIMYGVLILLIIVYFIVSITLD